MFAFTSCLGTNITLLNAETAVCSLNECLLLSQNFNQECLDMEYLLNACCKMAFAYTFPASRHLLSKC